jgi:hypothetical protein
MQTSIYLALRIALSALFVASAVTKSIDFTYFELQLLELPWLPAMVASPLGLALIVIEYALGIYFLAWFHHSKLFTTITYVFLAIFSVYLLSLFMTQGNEVNCGCMGQQIALSPVQALVKNALTAGILWLSSWFEKQMSLAARPSWLAFIWLLAGGVGMALSVPGILSTKIEVIEKPQAFDVELLMSNLHNASADFNPDRSNRYLIAFLSMSCGHCKIAARKLGHLKTSAPELHVFLVLNGDDTELPDFLTNQQVTHLPHAMLAAAPFVALAGYSVPYLAIIGNQHTLANPKLHELEMRFLSPIIASK